MTHRGAALMEWAHQQVVAFQSRPNQPGGTPLAVLVAEAYLHGANDALREEAESIKAAARIGQVIEPEPTLAEQVARLNWANWPDRGVADSAPATDAAG